MQNASPKSSAQATGLNAETLSSFKDRFPGPSYDRNALKAGIVHMSVGGFHRSHQAVYLDKFLNQFSEDWMITGIGLMPNDDINLKALTDQDGLYAVLERSPQKDEVRIVGSIKSLIHAPSNPAKVFEQIASPQTKILSLTVTEKGYYYDDKRNLDTNNPSIQSDAKLPERFFFRLF